MIDGLLTPEQVGELLALDPVTLAKWRTTAKGPAWIKIGRKAFYRLEDLQTWVAEQRVDPTRKRNPTAVQEKYTRLRETNARTDLAQVLNLPRVPKGRARKNERGIGAPPCNP